MGKLQVRNWSDAEAFSHLSDAALRKGMRFSEPMCLHDGRRMMTTQSIIISMGRCASLTRTYGGNPPPFHGTVAECDLFNIVSRASREWDEAPSGYFDGRYNNRRK